MFRENKTLAILTYIFLFLTLKTCRSQKSEPIPWCLANEPGDKRCTDASTFYNALTKDLSNVNTLDWSNFVIIMLIHESTEVDKLIDAHFSTWMKHVDGILDIVFVTDVDDKRSYEEILPRSKEVTVNCHLYKSPAQDDGKHIRYKVIDSLKYVEDAFKNNTEKQYFLKMDTDTFIIPQTLLDYTNKLHSEISTKPLQYGWGCCYTAELGLCYAAGAFYGFNKLGLEAVNSYMSENKEIIFKEVHSPFRFKTKNLIDHEDFMISLAYRRATNIPVVSNRRMFPHLIERSGLGTIDKPPISYHKIKDPKLFIMYEALFYDEDGSSRPYEETQKLLNFKTFIDKSQA